MADDGATPESKESAVSQPDPDHMERRQARTGHRQEVALAEGDDVQPEAEAPAAESGPVAEEDHGGKKSLLKHDLGEILEERKNYEADPEVREALQGLREIPVRDALDKT